MSTKMAPERHKTIETDLFAPTRDENHEQADHPAIATRNEIQNNLGHLRDSIEEQRKEKQRRRDFLQQECSKRRNPEQWTKNSPQESITNSIAKELINTGVEQQFTQYLEQFRENGLGDDTNINLIKQAAKDIIYEHYLKTGNDKDTTLAYIKNNLATKLKYLFNELKQISDNPQYGFKKPIDCLQTFSDFTMLNFISAGCVKLENLKSALLLEKSDYEFFLKSFTQYLNINLELVNLSGQEASNAAQQSQKLDIGQMLKDGKVILKNTVRVPITSNTQTNLTALKQAIYEQLSDNADPKTREAIAAYLTEQANKINAKEGEIITISTNGEIGKTNLAVEQAAQAKTIQQAQEQAQKTAAESTEGFSGTIGKFIAAIMAILQKLLSSFNDMASKVGLTEEFEGLNESETKEAAQFKATAQKAGLELKTLRPLFKDKDKMKKILAIKKNQGLTWEDYFKNYLTDSETDQLKKDQTLEAEKIAEMLTTPVEETGQKSASSPTAPTTPTAPSA